MTEHELQSIFNSLGNLHLVSRYFSDHPELLDDLITISVHDHHPKSWRAAWMIDKIHEHHPELIKPHLVQIAQFVLTTKNDSKRRHLLKVISLNDIPEEYAGSLLNYSLDLFTNAAIPVAVRVHAMQVLFNIALKEPDFSCELIQLIEHEIEYHATPGIASRG
jgi:hypothetical protein